jgi:cation diffusion facilitator family transporter
MTPTAPSKKTLVGRSLAIAGLLAILKLSVGIVTHSIAILASAADSLMDFLISLANYIFIDEAEKPADENHPYGHGKIESLAGLLQSIVIAIMAAGIIVGAALRLRSPKTLEQPAAGFIVMAIALLINWWHVKNLQRSVAKTGSQVMASEFVHYASDFLGYAGVIVAIALSQWTGLRFWDPLASICIALYLAWSALGIFRNSLSELLDEQLPEPIPSTLARIIRGHSPKIVDFHELRTRKVGETKFIEFHVELRGVVTFEEAHDLTESLIRKLRETYPGAVITVHTDPEGAD